jgi:hypothetical protein
MRIPRIPGKAMALTAACAVCIPATVAACSSSSSGSSFGPGDATVSGTIQGATVPASDVVGLYYVATFDGGVSQAQAGVIVTNVANACGVLQAHGNPPNATSLELVVSALGSSVATGNYAIVPQGYGASASYATVDGNCNPSFVDGATGGSITLTTVSGSTIAGTFDLTFGSDHLTGSFSAPICTYSAGDGGTSTCM